MGKSAALSRDEFLRYAYAYWLVYDVAKRSQTERLAEETGALKVLQALWKKRNLLYDGEFTPMHDIGYSPRQRVLWFTRQRIRTLSAIDLSIFYENKDFGERANDV